MLSSVSNQKLFVISLMRFLLRKSYLIFSITSSYLTFFWTFTSDIKVLPSRSLNLKPHKQKPRVLVVVSSSFLFLLTMYLLPFYVYFRVTVDVPSFISTQELLSLPNLRFSILRRYLGYTYESCGLAVVSSFLFSCLSTPKNCGRNCLNLNKGFDSSRFSLNIIS